MRSHKSNQSIVFLKLVRNFPVCTYAQTWNFTIYLVLQAFILYNSKSYYFYYHPLLIWVLVTWNKIIVDILLFKLSNLSPKPEFECNSLHLQNQLLLHSIGLRKVENLVPGGVTKYLYFYSPFWRQTSCKEGKRKSYHKLLFKHSMEGCLFEESFISTSL